MSRASSHRDRLFTAAGASVLASFLLPAAPASAHADLVRTWPEDGAAARGVVSEVRLTFASPLVPGLAEVVMTGARGRLAPVQVGVDGSQVVVRLAPLTRSGSYEVAYRAVALDGHAATGSYEFVVSAASARAAREHPGRRPSADETGFESGAVRVASTPGASGSSTGAIGAAAVAAAVGLGLLRRRRSSSPPERPLP